MQNIPMIIKSRVNDNMCSPLIAPWRISTPYVTGNIYESQRTNIGSDRIGTNNPHRNIIGKRKKLEKVWASNTSLADTEIKRPRKVDTIPMRIMAGTTRCQAIPDISVRNAAITMGTNALTIPKRIAPEVLANMSNSREIGARSNLSNDRFRLSKVRVTDSKEVVPNSIEMVITPGKSYNTLSSPSPDLMKNIPVQANGKIIPQLMLGGLK